MSIVDEFEMNGVEDCLVSIAPDSSLSFSSEGVSCLAGEQGGWKRCETSKKLIVVVHILHEDDRSVESRTLEQVKIAFENGAHGVFLTVGEAGLDVRSILNCYSHCREWYPTAWIGINFMSDPVESASMIPMDASALWIDKGLGQVNFTEEMVHVKRILEARNWKGLYFGGFCLKGNNQILFDDHDYFRGLEWNPEAYFDVCVTSGMSTGIPIDKESLKIVKSKSNGVPLALASGINLDNVHHFVDAVEYFVVGTGVEQDSHDSNIIEFYREAGLPHPVMVGYLDAEKVKNLASKLTFLSQANT